jgi:hypothetical protein
MALFDSADLLARVKREVDEPAVSEEQGPSDADHTAFWYAYLTEAQLYWMTVLAGTAPDENYTSEQLTTADNGVSYSFSAEPLGGQIEIRSSQTGRILTPGPDWDSGSDFVIDGAKIRFPGGKAMTFSGGPWARYVKTPDVIDGTHPPVLLPTVARILLVHRACILWAQRGGLRDPTPYVTLENEAWFGKPDGSQLGILNVLRNKWFGQGTASLPQSGLTIFDLGGYWS